MKTLIVVSIICILSGVTLSLWLAVRTGGGVIAFTVLYGFVSGGLVSLPPVTVASLSKNQDEYSTRIGMAFTICSFGALVGNPIAGTLLVTVRKAGGSNPFLGPWLFAGGAMIAAGALTILAYYLHNDGKGRRGDSGLGSGTDHRLSSKWIQSLANEALTMQGAAGAAFAL
jgi:hypothetical protein